MWRKICGECDLFFHEFLPVYGGEEGVTFYVWDPVGAGPQSIAWNYSNIQQIGDVGRLPVRYNYRRYRFKVQRHEIFFFFIHRPYLRTRFHDYNNLCSSKDRLKSAWKNVENVNFQFFRVGF